VIVELPAYPSAGRVQAAARYLAGRAGASAFAVVDDHGRLAGHDLDRRFSSASMVKSMMLVAYLQMLARQHRPLDRSSRTLLYPMIHSSDNRAASSTLAIVGQRALDRVAREAGMRDYERARGWWAFTQVSAADMARFFFRQDALVPRRFDGYARELLSSIEPSQSWGIPTIARPEFQVYFKGGWLAEEGVVNQAGRLERPRITFAMAVLTQGDPSMPYGEQTIAGVTARLLGRAA
jgi:Beta-lactamase enzyme family